MKSEWNSYILSDIVNIIGGGTPKRSIPDYWGGNIPWLSVVDFNSDNKHVFDTKESITELGLEKSSTKLLDSGQLIISARGTVGALAQLAKPMTFNQSCYGLDANKEYTTNDYLYYLLKKKVRDLQQITHGAVFDTITRDTFKQIDVDLPPLPIQKKIAHILSTLDDKIELNRKMNQTLEAMAQALFKSWFVDFDPVRAKAEAKSEAELEAKAKELGISKEVLDLFPSRLVESEMGMIPEGWEVNSLKEFGQVVTGKTPSTKKKENYGEKYPFITIPDMHNQIFIVDTVRYLSEDGHSVQRNKLIPKDSLIVSCIATVGLVSINSEDSHTNQQINSIVCSKKYLYYLYCMLSSMTDRLIMYGGAGTATLNVNKSTFENIQVVKPADILLDRFLELVKPMFEQLLENTKQIQTLQKTRDTLLPKLLSGELDVSNIEIEEE